MCKHYNGAFDIFDIVMYLCVCMKLYASFWMYLQVKIGGSLEFAFRVGPPNSHPIFFLVLFDQKKKMVFFLRIIR